jgi:hypothetical protein
VDLAIAGLWCALGQQFEGGGIDRGLVDRGKGDAAEYLG